MATKTVVKDINEKTNSMLIFHLADCIMAIELRWVKEILPAVGLVPLPNSVPHVAGMLNVRGDIVPVLKGSDMLAVEYDEALLGGKEKDFVLLIRYHNNNFGLQINEVQRLINVAGDNIFEFHDEEVGHIKKEFVTHSITHEEDVVVPVIDAHKLSEWCINTKFFKENNA